MSLKRSTSLIVVFTVAILIVVIVLLVFLTTTTTIIRGARRSVDGATTQTTTNIFDNNHNKNNKNSDRDYYSVLFIGNSYTSANNLPSIFTSVVTKNNGGMIPEWQEASDNNNNHRLYTERVAPGGWTLYQHWNDFQYGTSDLTTLLAPTADANNNNNNENKKHEWKWVILQDQSQIPGLYQESDSSHDNDEYSLSYQGAIGLNHAIRDATGAETMFFMTWGRKNGDDQNPNVFPDFLTMQKHLTEGYKRYQNATSTVQRPTFIAPVGLVFETIYNDDLNLRQEVIPTKDDGTLFSNLYANDGSHPSTLGSYVAALTIYSSMTGLDPTRINYWPSSNDDSTITETMARLVQDAIKRTLIDTAASGFIQYPWTIMQ